MTPVTDAKNGDGRRIPHDVLEEIRLRAARQMLDGAEPEELAEALGLNRSTLYLWQKTAKDHGIEALRAKPHPGKAPRLTKVQMAELFAMVNGHDPRDYGFAESLWTRDVVNALVKRHFGFCFSPQWTGRILRNLGFSPQRPLYRASEQDPAALEAWRQQVYPAIRAQAAPVRATVYFGDESGVSANFHAGTTWAPVGHTPIVSATASRARVNMVSAIEQRGRLHFMVTEGSFTSIQFCEFLTKLLADDGGLVYLIVDNGPVHTSAYTREFVTKLDGKLKLFHLPTYAPTLNPDEWVWKNVKHDQIGKMAPKNKSGHRQRVVEALEALQAAPELVRRFFLDPHLAYISAISPAST